MNRMLWLGALIAITPLITAAEEEGCAPAEEEEDGFVNDNTSNDPNNVSSNNQPANNDTPTPNNQPANNASNNQPVNNDEEMLDTPRPFVKISYRYDNQIFAPDGIDYSVTIREERWISKESDASRCAQSVAISEDGEEEGCDALEITEDLIHDHSCDFSEIEGLECFLNTTPDTSLCESLLELEGDALIASHIAFDEFETGEGLFPDVYLYCDALSVGSDGQLFYTSRPCYVGSGVTDPGPDDISCEDRGTDVRNVDLGVDVQSCRLEGHYILCDGR